MRRPMIPALRWRKRGHAFLVRPILPVHDLDAAQAFHRRLGFDVQRYSDDYAWVHHAWHELFHLRVVADLDVATNPTSAYVFADDVDAWYRRCRGAGVGATPVRDEPWGMREFAVTDPSGNLLRIGCVVGGED